MTVDIELDDLRREWRHDTEPLPELKRRIHRQNRHLSGGAVAIAVCLTLATIVGLRSPGGWGGFAVGIWVATVVGVGYVLWLRRGAWEPAAQTSQAYLDLLHRRAVAEVKKIVFLRWSLVAVLVGYSAFVFWNGRHLGVRGALVIAGIVIESVWMRVLERRRRIAADDAARLLDDTQDGAGPRLQERMYSK